jgi:hypothetical protein
MSRPFPRRLISIQYAIPFPSQLSNDTSHQESQIRTTYDADKHSTKTHIHLALDAITEQKNESVSLDHCPMKRDHFDQAVVCAFRELFESRGDPITVRYTADALLSCGNAGYVRQCCEASKVYY